MKNNLESHIEKNKNILIYVDGKLMSRDEAKVSVYDSGFMMGDGIWEGIRLVNEKWLFLDDHIDRLFDGAKAIDLDIGLTKAEIKQELFKTQKANKMTDKTDSPKLIRSETTNTTLVRRTCLSCFRVLLNLLKKKPKEKS